MPRGTKPVSVRLSGLEFWVHFQAAVMEMEVPVSCADVIFLGDYIPESGTARSYGRFMFTL